MSWLNDVPPALTPVHRDLRDCPPCRAKLLAAGKAALRAAAAVHSAFSVPHSALDVSLSVIIPCLNDDRPLWLPEIKSPDGKSILQRAAMWHSNSLQMTLDSVALTSAGLDRTEVIIADDASNPPVRFTAPKGLRVRVVRTEKTLGTKGCRNLGARESRADVIGFLDSHAQIAAQVGRAPIMAGLQRLAALALEKNCIVVGRCGHLENFNRSDSYPMCGARFVKIPEGGPAALPVMIQKNGVPIPRYFFGLEWNHITPPDVIERVPAVLGACYFFPRALYERIGGFIEECRAWGASEEGLSLKAALMNVPILFCGHVTVLHWFRCGGPHPFVVDGYQKFLNYPKTCKIVFAPDTFEKFWLPRFRRMANWNVRYEADLNAPEVLAAHTAFRKKVVRPDAEVIRELFGVQP